MKIMYVNCELRNIEAIFIVMNTTEAAVKIRFKDLNP